MILEFGFKNFFSFKEGAVISFRLDANCPTTISNGLNFTPVLGIKGANGSGKTNVLRALTFLSFFASESFKSDPEKAIAFESFFLSKSPTEFYIEFIVKKIYYRYELTLTTSEVLNECLYRKKLKEVKLFERKKQKLVSSTKEFAVLDNIKLRKNASIISTCKHLDLGPLKDIFPFFDDFFSNVTYSGLRQDRVSMSQACKILVDNPDVFEFVKAFIKKIDIGVSDIEIITQKNEDNKDIYFPIFTHDHEKTSIKIPDAVESSGTKALMKYLASHWYAINNGTINIVDELDINLHPFILEEILKLYTDINTNPNHGQLIFTTHNTEILDFLGRYRTYLINKEDNASYCYRLDEIPGDILRNDRPISPAYLDQKIGGVPNFK